MGLPDGTPALTPTDVGWGIGGCPVAPSVPLAELTQGYHRDSGGVGGDLGDKGGMLF